MDGNLKIVHVAPSFARRDGGPAEVLRGLLPIQEIAHEVVLITTDKGVEPGETIDVKRVVSTKAIQPHRWTFSPGILRPLFQYLDQADIVHCHGVHTFTTTSALKIARRINVPVVVQPHGSLDGYHFAQRHALKSTYLRMVDGRSLSAARGLIVSSTLEAREAAIQLPKFSSWIVPNGVDESLFRLKRAPNPERFQILFLGRVARKKRLDLVLKAIKLLQNRGLNAELLVAGPFWPDLPYDPRVLVRELGIESKVTFLGVVDADTRRKLLSQCGAFVLPSEDESFGVAVAEALAAGCPVLASSHVGLAEEAAEAGALSLCALDPQDIATKLEDLTQPALAEELGLRGRKYAADRYSWRGISAQLDTVYRAAMRDEI